MFATFSKLQSRYPWKLHKSNIVIPSTVLARWIWCWLMHSHKAVTKSIQSAFVLSKLRILSKSYRTHHRHWKVQSCSKTRWGRKSRKQEGFVSCLHVLMVETTCNARIERAIKSQSGRLSARLKASMINRESPCDGRNLSKIYRLRDEFITNFLARHCFLSSLVSFIIDSPPQPFLLLPRLSRGFFCHDLR